MVYAATQKLRAWLEQLGLLPGRAPVPIPVPHRPPSYPPRDHRRYNPSQEPPSIGRRGGG